MGLLNPKNYIAGGGLLNDRDATVVSAKFVMFDYRGNMPQAVPALEVVFQTDDGEEFTEYFTVGDRNDWAPSPDGKKIQPVGRATALKETTKVAIFLNSIYTAGAPEAFFEELSEDITNLVGLKGHFVRIKTERRGAKDTEDLVMTDLIALPGEADVQEQGDIEAIAAEVIVEAAQGGEIKKGTLLAKGMRVIREMDLTPEQVEAVTELLSDEEFLQKQNGWNYDGRKVWIG